MYKNRLKDLMLERNISNHKLAKETTISRQAISKIKNNAFHDISVNVLTELLDYFNVSFEEFGTPYSRERYLKELIPKKGFNENNLKILEQLLNNHLHISCSYSPYASKQILNFHSKKYYKDLYFSGNIRINTSLHGLTFEVIDFDLYTSKNSYSFEKFYIFYKNFLNQLEKYATDLGFTQIIFNINSYFDDTLKKIIEPRFVEYIDLKYLFDSFDYSERENELLKLSLLHFSGYIEYVPHENYLKTKQEKDKLNNYINSFNNLNFFDKEIMRSKQILKNKLEVNHYTKKFIKQLNPEIISKEKLKKDRERRWKNS